MNKELLKKAEKKTIEWLKNTKYMYVGDFNGEYDLESICLDGNFNFTKLLPAIIELVKEEIRERVVIEYTDFLIKYNYVDSDVYTEEPKAVERFLSSLNKPLAEKSKEECKPNHHSYFENTTTCSRCGESRISITF